MGVGLGVGLGLGLGLGLGTTRATWEAQGLTDLPAKIAAVHRGDRLPISREGQSPQGAHSPLPPPRSLLHPVV